MALPASVLGDGNVRVVWITTFNGSVLTAATVTAGVDLSCYFTADGFNRGINEAAVVDDRLCSTQSGEQPGRWSETLDLMYVYDAQNVVPTDNLAYTTLLPGAKGFFVVRYAMPYTTAAAAAQKVDVIGVTLGQQNKQSPAANEVLKVAQKASIAAGGTTKNQALT